MEDEVKKEEEENDNENDYFFIRFINEKILLEKIQDEQQGNDGDVKMKCYEIAPEEVSFDSDEYIRNIYKSYQMELENIYNQYKKDFTRQVVLIDNSIVTDANVFETFVNKFQRYKFVDDYDDGKVVLCYNNLFIMLATQSSYYFMYLYSKTFESKFRKLYNNPDLYIVNGSNKAIHFETNRENEISFKAILTLFLKDINDDKRKLNIIYLELNIIFKLIGDDSIFANMFNLFNYNSYTKPNKETRDINYGTITITIV